MRRTVFSLAFCSAVCLLAAATALPCRAAGSDIIYRNDFQGAVGPEWSNSATDTAPLSANRRFLGRFDNNTVQLTLDGLPKHSQITLAFDLYVIGDWEGNSATQGPDVFNVSVADGAPVLNTTFSNGTNQQAFPEPFPGGDNPARSDAVENNTLGYTVPVNCAVQIRDAVYHVTLVIPHTKKNIGLRFSGSGLTANETWGLDNVDVTSQDFPPGKIHVSPNKINFGNVRVGSNKTRQIHIRNTSKGPLHGNVGFVTAPFQVVSGSGSFTLNRHQSITVVVRFSPSTNAQSNDVLLITSDAKKHDRITVNVSGRGKLH